MKKEGFISAYTKTRFKYGKSEVNEATIPNHLDRQFDHQRPRTVISGDLTYFWTTSGWCYLCVPIDLFNREIVGYSIGERHSTRLVVETFRRISFRLNQIQLFHSDRGGEFKGIALIKSVQKSVAIPDL